MKTGIILANTGTPDAPTPEAVERYLRQFLTHARIRPMPAPLWNVVLERFILPRRKVSSAGKYSLIWTREGSPLSVTQGSLTGKVQRSLRADGHDVVVVSAMSFGSPSLADAVSRLESEGCERLVVLPLYPQYAYSNAGIVEDDVRALAATHKIARDATVVRDYWDSDEYIDAIVQSVVDAGFDAASGDLLVLTYHSVPRADIAHGDTYDVTTKGTTDAVAQRLSIGARSYAMCYQSRFDKGRKWLDPFLGPCLEEAAANPALGRVFVATPGFAIDCLETIYDIDIVLRERFHEVRDSCGTAADEGSFVRISCLNDTPEHVSVCSSALLPHLA